ncbi:hypothetical protein DICVIV_04248 [Dictyocaulus viviparus]|uniref:Uncharacterized protein n=1 Tax=Dictyocaulus viviparus TaxID=29172 RepID=A0A0D8XY92_DICVI|nr:hypothetical protein DICVIV_04248 [Dictyocaulus viviparus]
MRMVMEAGDLRVPEIPLASGEDDIDGNKNSQHGWPDKLVFFGSLRDQSSPPYSPNSREVVLP